MKGAAVFALLMVLAWTVEVHAAPLDDQTFIDAVNGLVETLWWLALFVACALAFGLGFIGGRMR